MGSGPTGGILRGATPYNTLNRNGPDACHVRRLRSRLHQLLCERATLRHSQDRNKRRQPQRSPTLTAGDAADPGGRHHRPDLPGRVRLPGTHRPPLTCYNTLSSTNPTMKVYAVIAGTDYEGEDFNSLRLFDCRSSAEDYELELQQQICVDYTRLEVREVCMDSALATA